MLFLIVLSDLKDWEINPLKRCQFEIGDLLVLEVIHLFFSPFDDTKLIREVCLDKYIF
jgi:hypothetical protein